MGNKNRSNVLLVEILLVVLFLMLSATVLMQVFAASRSLTLKAGAQTRALIDAQNVADQLVSAESPEDMLGEAGFLGAHGVWTKDCGDYTLYVEGAAVPAGVGEMWRGVVRVFYKQLDTNVARRQDEEMFSLPCCRYRGVQS